MGFEQLAALRHSKKTASPTGKGQKGRKGPQKGEAVARTGCRFGSARKACRSGRARHRQTSEALPTGLSKEPCSQGAAQDRYIQEPHSAYPRTCPDGGAITRGDPDLMLRHPLLDLPGGRCIAGGSGRPGGRARQPGRRETGVASASPSCGKNAIQACKCVEAQLIRADAPKVRVRQQAQRRRATSYLRATHQRECPRSGRQSR